MKCALLFVVLCGVALNVVTAAPKDCVPAAADLSELRDMASSMDVATEAECPAAGVTGIAMTMGTQRHVDNAYATLSVLRNQQKSSMPVTIYHWNNEVPESVREMFVNTFGNIQFVDLFGLRATTCGEEVPEGFAIKALAVSHARTYYQHLLWMDVDTLLLTTPESLFESEDYKAKGNVFWPDFFNGWVNEKIYDELTTEKPSQVADTESGQLLIDTCKHQDVLEYVKMLNQQSRVTYEFMFGDKDTFRLAFAMANKLDEFNQISFQPGSAFTTVETSPELQRVRTLERTHSSDESVDILEQSAARCAFERPALMVGMIQSDASSAPAFFHRTNAEFSLRSQEQIRTEFILAPQGPDQLKELLWQVQYPSMAWAVCVDEASPLEAPAAITNVEAFASDALSQLTEEIVSGGADDYTEMRPGVESEIVRAMTVMSGAEIFRRTGNSSDDNSTSTDAPTAAPTAAPTSTPTIEGEVSVTATIALTGVTAEQFTEDVQGAFKDSIASALDGIDSEDIEITSFSYARRGALTVEFKVYTDSADTSVADTVASTLTTHLEDSSSGGFASSFTTAAQAADSSFPTISASDIAITEAAAVVTQAPTAAPTGAPTAAPTTTVVDSAPVSAGLSLAAIAGLTVAIQQIM